MQERKSEYLSIFKHQKYQYLYVTHILRTVFHFVAVGANKKDFECSSSYFEKHSFFNFLLLK